MNHEIEALFYSMFPELFRGRFKPVEESLMCYGFECDDMWFFLLWQHCMELEKAAIVEGRVRGTEEWPEIVQIKEKLGTLRCHVRNESDFMRGLRFKLMADSESYES